MPPTISRGPRLALVLAILGLVLAFLLAFTVHPFAAKKGHVRIDMGTLLPDTGLFPNEHPNTICFTKNDGTVIANLPTPSPSGCFPTEIQNTGLIISGLQGEVDEKQKVSASDFKILDQTEDDALKRAANQLGQTMTTVGSNDDHSAKPKQLTYTSDQKFDMEVKQKLKRLDQGNLAYATPQEMTTGQVADVNAAIGSSSVKPNALTATFTGGNSDVQTVPTPITVKMVMGLAGTEFVITPSDPVEQIVGGPLPTIWNWQISPKHGGTLHLILSSKVEINGSSSQFTTVQRDIAVKVDYKYEGKKFVGDNWKWIWGAGGTVFGALTSLLFPKRKSDDKNKDKGQAGDDDNKADDGNKS